MHATGPLPDAIDTPATDGKAIRTWTVWLLGGAILLHAFMFFSLFFGYLNPFFDNSDQQPQAIDFFSIYQGGTFILHNTSIYSFVPAHSVPYAAPYRYLPVFAYTFALPLNAIPPWSGYWLWVSLIEVMLFANAWLTFRVAADRTWGIIGAAMWFAFSPLYLEQYMGQWSFLMATLMLWTGVALVRERPQAAGIPWAASVLIKTNSALLGPLFLRLRQWRVLALTLLALVVLNAPYFLLRPGDGKDFWDINFGQYWRVSPGRALFQNSGDLGGISLLRTVWLAFDLNAQDVPAWLARAVVLTAFGVSAAATFLPRRTDIIALFSIWSAVYFIAYFSWEHHYVMLLPALALLLVQRPEHRVLTLIVWAFVALPTPYWLFQRYLSEAPPGPLGLQSPQLYWPQWAAILDHATKVVPVFVLWAALCTSQLQSAWRDRKPPPGLAAHTSGR